MLITVQSSEDSCPPLMNSRERTLAHLSITVTSCLTTISEKLESAPVKILLDPSRRALKRIAPKGLEPGRIVKNMRMEKTEEAEKKGGEERIGRGEEERVVCMVDEVNGALDIYRKQRGKDEKR